MKVPYVSLGKEALVSLEPFLADIPAFLASGQFILGKSVEAFESTFAKFHGVKHAVAVNSGLDALTIALLSCGVGPGTDVITASNSFVATAAAIANTGATIVFADVGADRNIDPARVRALVNARTKAIVPVHLAGLPADITSLREFADPLGIAVVEDCAQAVGSAIGGHLVGTFGRAGCYSFHPLKNLGALGDGGCIVTSDDKVAERARLLRNHGLLDRNTTAFWGYNSRLDALQAIWLERRLALLPGILSRRQEIARQYISKLSGIPGLLVPTERTGTRHTWHAFVIQTAHRDELRDHFARNGIEALIHYPSPIHLQPAARGLGYVAGSLPNTEAQARRILSLPVRASLDDDEVDFVANRTLDFFSKLADRVIVQQ